MHNVAISGIFFIFFVAVVRAEQQAKTASQRLTEHLLSPERYSPYVRPVRNHAHPVILRHRMNLYQILDVNEPSQSVSLYLWVSTYWNDSFMGWNPSDYDGIEYIVLPCERVWLPDTILYNSVEMVRENSERLISVIYFAKRNGTGLPYAEATLQYPAIYRFTCKMNIFYFPFDTQNCSMTFGSWVYDADGIDYYPYRNHVTFESYVQNEEWKVLSFNYEREAVYYNCCATPWILIHVYLHIKRKSLYYVSNLVLPTGIITFIAIVGFFSPTNTTGERTEKVNLGITTLLAMSILLLMVSDQMPTTSNFIPIMGWFFLIIILLISMGTVITSIILAVHQQGNYGRRLNRRIRKIFFNYVAPCLWIKPHRNLQAHLKLERLNSLTVKQRRKPFKETKKERSEPNVPTSPPLSPRFNGTKSESSGLQTNGGQHTFVPHLALNLITEIKGSLEKLNEYRDVICDEAVEHHLIEMEWAYFASILDRILLLIFGSAALFLTFGMLAIDWIQSGADDGIWL